MKNFSISNIKWSLLLCLLIILAAGIAYAGNDVESPSEEQNGMILNTVSEVSEYSFTGISLTPRMDWKEVIVDNKEAIYELQVSTDPDFKNIILMKTELPSSEYTMEFPLNALTEYYWRTRYVSENGSGGWTKVNAFKTASITKLKPISSDIPSGYVLNQNFPNPFNPSTNIKFDIPAGNNDLHKVKLTISNLLGETMATLYDGELAAGQYEIQVNGSKMASGTYFYELRSDDFRSIKRMTLIK